MAERPFFVYPDFANSLPNPAERRLHPNQSTYDYLSAMVNECVENHIVGFRIRPFVSSDQKTIYVVEVPDSLDAPHQSRADYRYYYRIPGHSKPAPHFYLELLRNSKRKCIVAIEGVELLNPIASPKEVGLDLKITVRNLSSWVAQPVGISFGTHDPDSPWSFIYYTGKMNPNKTPETIAASLKKRHAITVPLELLFPGLTHAFSFTLHSNYSQHSNARDKMTNFRFCAHAFSQDFASPEFVITKESFTKEEQSKIKHAVSAMPLPQ